MKQMKTKPPVTKMPARPAPGKPAGLRGMKAAAPKMISC